MNRIIRVTAVVTVLALSFAPRFSLAGDAAPRTAKNCFFVRNHLPCPCPKAKDVKAVAHAARVTAGALGTAFGTTAVALSRAEKASQPAQPFKQ
jgi:hypothetical protein